MRELISAKNRKSSGDVKYTRKSTISLFGEDGAREERRNESSSLRPMGRREKQGSKLNMKFHSQTNIAEKGEALLFHGIVIRWLRGFLHRGAEKLVARPPISPTL